MRKVRLLAGMAALVLASQAQASDAVLGEETTFTSPNGVTERCVRIARMPAADYSKKDLKIEEEYCALDFYAEDIALCPKTWSTSPGMMIYDISKGSYANDRHGFERRACSEGKSASGLAHKQIAKFKSTMNGKGTSGTFSASSLLYYHFSRYFGADIGVPPAVWRTMDRKAHLSELARPGLAFSGHSHSSSMNSNGWKIFVEADQKPETYRPTDELFTSDREAIYGALLDSPGTRYTSEVNGTRKSGWGKGQNFDFQETAPFLALRSTAPLNEAVRVGVASALKDPQIRGDMGTEVAPQQVVYWMTEIANIVLLDYIFSQQDRIGNIDFRPYWHWVEDGEIKTHRANIHDEAERQAYAHAILIKRTRLNDNDAGGRVQYANFAKSTQMLEKLRHFPAKTYRQLITLDADFAAQGPLYAYVRDSFGLDASQLKQVVKNTELATAILKESCAKGDLIFDLDPDTYFLTQDTLPEPVSCDGQ